MKSSAVRVLKPKISGGASRRRQSSEKRVISCLCPAGASATEPVGPVPRASALTRAGKIFNEKFLQEFLINF